MNLDFFELRNESFRLLSLSMDLKIVATMIVERIPWGGHRRQSSTSFVQSLIFFCSGFPWTETILSCNEKPLTLRYPKFSPVLFVMAW
ncbi:hypothetical protein EUGRSUZ_A01000 [Eucalyptus grandis]|uniref:Uncharacterized protein n=2 Tax=Eucalyptus grandis TaxID=71139 RepID=A0ACC3M4S2_EUCGR|nr:hypothetical protein EUGRSUZ_A01000 [Eucalyptus grandis]